MKISRLLSLLSLLLVAALTVTWAQTSTNSNSATWTWTAPTTYTDGTPIPSGTVLTYKLFTSPTASIPTITPAWTGTALTTTTSGYAGGSTVYGVVEACVAAGCSVPSVSASKTFPFPAPAAPGALTVK